MTWYNILSYAGKDPNLVAIQVNLIGKDNFVGTSLLGVDKLKTEAKTSERETIKLKKGRKEVVYIAMFYRAIITTTLPEILKSCVQPSANFLVCMVLLTKITLSYY